MKNSLKATENTGKNDRKAGEKMSEKEKDVITENTGKNDRKAGEKMSEKEKDVINTIAEALPKMSDMDKGYFLGYAEALASRKEQEEKHEGAKQD